MKFPPNLIALVEEIVEAASSSDSVHQTRRIVEYTSSGRS